MIVEILNGSNTNEIKKYADKTNKSGLNNVLYVLLLNNNKINIMKKLIGIVIPLRRTDGSLSKSTPPSKNVRLKGVNTRVTINIVKKRGYTLFI